jgi:hypothetical protein
LVRREMEKRDMKQVGPSTFSTLRPDAKKERRNIFFLQFSNYTLVSLADWFFCNLYFYVSINTPFLILYMRVPFLRCSKSKHRNVMCDCGDEKKNW